MNDHETLGKIFSDRLQSECGSDINHKWTSSNEYILRAWKTQVTIEGKEPKGNNHRDLDLAADDC